MNKGLIKVTYSELDAEQNTLEFLSIWEQMNNEFFKGVGFDTFKKEAGLNKEKA